MIFTALGVYGRFAPEGSATNSYLVEGGGASVLVDCGSGAVSRIGDETLKNLDAVILTHLHGDHAADFLTLQYRFDYLFKGKRPFKVFLPASPRSGFAYFSANDGYEYTVLSPRSVDIKGLKLEFFKMSHPVETYGVLFDDGKKLFYTSDSDIYGDFSAVESADAIIGDACVSEADGTTPHIAVEALATICKGKKLYLGHLDKATEARVLKEAAKIEPSAELPVQGKSYKV